ncbi:MAG: MotA/TolQ/ExbB proton channel family protein [Melioribacteraceae bacterium]|nr:MotA/TolQ/ExbB proton channel family protein [Melioribacteraceae bacterium]
MTILLSIVFFIPHVSAQDEAQSPSTEDTTTVADGELSETEDSASIWEMVGQAGPIQYPIYLILISGIFLISMRSYEFYMDRQMSEELESTSFRHMSLNEISSKISTQPDYMLSRIMAKLLNVFETNRNADYLHDEITNYNNIQQDNFDTFKNRIDFLSDTAGALGLLGTVWGMFIVFSSGTLEKETILMGMGLALMSTLLGLVVSITLNFSLR